MDRGDDVLLAEAFGLAHRAFEIPNTVDTRFGTASGTKGFTALTVMSLVQDGTLDLATTARSLLGDDLPLIDDRVTVEHLLAHRSGIGDYFDEEIERPITDHVLTVPVHELATIESHLRVLDGYPEQVRARGAVLVLQQRLRRPRAARRACRPARRSTTWWCNACAAPPGCPTRRSSVPTSSRVRRRSDTSTRTAIGPTCSISPVRGAGDGGIYTTAADIAALWTALFDGRIVSLDLVTEMVRPRSDADDRRYGLGFWLHGSLDIVDLHGYDAGVSFRSVHDPKDRLTHTVLSNTSKGAWAITRHLDEVLLPSVGAQ